MEIENSMKVLFLTLLNFNSLQEKNIYTDLLRVFVKNGHEVYAISPVERKLKQKTYMVYEKNAVILRLRIGNIQKTNIVEKGISTVLIEPTYKKAIKKYFSDIKFDLVLYSTPPITLIGAIEYVKKRDGAKSYLLLKDIFPQNAVDIGLISKKGIKGLLYKHFRRQEKRLYEMSDYIGCMSQANVEYLLNNNSYISSKKVEICPNSVEVVDKSVDDDTKKIIREKYAIPIDKKIFVYGGNLGKPQGVPFIIKCIRACQNMEDIFFLIVGDGTEYHMIENYVNNEKPSNVKLLNRLPKEDYDNMVGACDVGMIFLDHCFIIPNFPSRLLSYMQAKIPVLACTDNHTDIGSVIETGGFGWKCESDSVEKFIECIKVIQNSSLFDMKKREWDYLCKKYDVRNSYKIIIDTIERNY